MKRRRSSRWVAARSAEYGHALRFILSSGARINEALQLHADKVFTMEGQVELLGKGGRIRKISVLHAEALHELDLSERADPQGTFMQRRIPHALSEKIMLTVTKVNDYCYDSCARALMALKAGAMRPNFTICSPTTSATFKLTNNTTRRARRSRTRRHSTSYR